MIETPPLPTTGPFLLIPLPLIAMLCISDDGFAIVSCTLPDRVLRSSRSNLSAPPSSAFSWITSDPGAGAWGAVEVLAGDVAACEDDLEPHPARAAAARTSAIKPRTRISGPL